MIYIVTGTPGTGKTTFAKDFAQKSNCLYIDGNDIIKKYGLQESFDEETQSYVVDEQKFAASCVSEIKNMTEDAIIDSHLSHYIPAEHVAVCYVTECDVGVLQKRLIARKYSDKKVQDNLDAERFKVCRVEATDAGHNVQVIDTSKQ